MSLQDRLILSHLKRTHRCLNEISELSITKAKNKILSTYTDTIGIEDYLNRFKILSDKKKIKGVDLMSLDPMRLKEIVDRAEKTKSNSEKDTEIKENEAIKVYENALAIVVKPLTFRASCKYGANTKWCTTWGNIDFMEYASKSGLYYVISKKTNEKFAVRNDGSYTVWDAMDNDYEGLNIIKDLKIPKSVFSFDPIEYKDINESIDHEEIQADKLYKIDENTRIQFDPVMENVWSFSLINTEGTKEIGRIYKVSENDYVARSNTAPNIEKSGIDIVDVALELCAMLGEI